MQEIFLGFYFGVIATVLLYNLQWYRNSKEKSYLYYILMHISIVLVFLHGYQIFQTNILFGIASAVIFSILFSSEFLNLKKYYQKIHSLINKFIVAYIVFIGLLYMLNLEHIIGLIPQSLIFIPFLILGYVIYKKGNALALYFIVGWGLFTFAILANYIYQQIGGDNELGRIIVQTGNILQMVILSFALSKKTKILMEEKNEQEKMLIHQSRLASMGEMLANISHQWRQPLNRIASFIMNMQMHIYDNYKNEKYLLNKLDESQAQLEYMSHTIDDFTNFYKKEKERTVFQVSSVIQNATSIIKSTLASNHITLELSIEEDFELNAYPKELAQVVLNILQNAKDQLVIKQIAQPVINIKVTEQCIEISDNAHGISEALMQRIFEPYFSTKEKHKGTGLGLYMSKIILEKNFNATIGACNTNKGAKFVIQFHQY